MDVHFEMFLNLVRAKYRLTYNIGTMEAIEIVNKHVAIVENGFKKGKNALSVVKDINKVERYQQNADV